MNRGCDFNRDRPLPILAVDEPIYRRLPCFLIATVDKFAGHAVDGRGGRLLRATCSDSISRASTGRATRTAAALLPDGRLLPPDLIIQDELHLISGPLGTMVGLYETALDELCGAWRQGVGPRSSPRPPRCGAPRARFGRCSCSGAGGHLPTAGTGSPGFVLRAHLLRRTIHRRRTRDCTWESPPRDAARRS